MLCKSSSDQQGSRATHFFFYKQPYFRVEPRVAIKMPEMRLKVAMKLLVVFLESRLKVAKLVDNLGLKCMENKQKFEKLTEVAKNF